MYVDVSTTYPDLGLTISPWILAYNYCFGSIPSIFVFVVSIIAQFLILLNKQAFSSLAQTETTIEQIAKKMIKDMKDELSTVKRAVADALKKNEDYIRGLIEENRSNLDAMKIYGVIAGCYAPLSASSSLAQLHGGVWSDTDGRFELQSTDKLCHISIHSEVLYYSLVCSLLQQYHHRIERLDRCHIVLPNSATSLFLPEILKCFSHLDPAVQRRFYLFRNNVIDYNRNSLKTSEYHRQGHLWPTFAKASRILFRDSGAYFGFYNAQDIGSIWSAYDLQFRNDFENNCERFRLEVQGSDKVISGVLRRDANTFDFKEAMIFIGDDELVEQPFRPSVTKQFFDTLWAKRDLWQQADNWKTRPVEVALVSGEEMESEAAPNIELWAIDDYDESLKDHQNAGWETPGSSRYIAWEKTIVAALKGATVHRLFLVDRLEVASNKSFAINLFATMASQHMFLSAINNHGSVKLIVKDSECKMEGMYPDYMILIENNGKIKRGVSWMPGPKSLSQYDKEFITKKNVIDSKSIKFPWCFEPIKDTLDVDSKGKIVKLMSEHRELREMGESDPAFKIRLKDEVKNIFTRLNA